jgi:hypothetical protein
MSKFQEITDTLFKPHGYRGVDWAMTFAEKFAMVGILERLRPEMALEIGTLNGGSLSVISRYAERVVSIDPNPEVKARLGDTFCNVDFITDSSRNVLPGLIDDLNGDKRDLQFVLIDGDHSEDGVRRDILDVLKYRPRTSLWILMHDSFNPDCRRAMKSIDWEANPHVHWINYDFIPGFLSNLPGWEDQMWCGFALAYLEARPREGKLAYGELLGRQFDKLLPVSAHAEKG